jgi:tRNA A37 threonylcarbamoyladenosine synthetase subunit TsaC/SUA5/YrdC
MQTSGGCVIEPSAAGIAQAAALLREGAVVAFPTETVYGLGGNAFNEEAVSLLKCNACMRSVVLCN